VYQVPSILLLRLNECISFAVIENYLYLNRTLLQSAHLIRENILSLPMFLKAIRAPMIVKIVGIVPNLSVIAPNILNNVLALSVNPFKKSEPNNVFESASQDA